MTGAGGHDGRGLVEIQYFTDPLCCWSWAFEPQWRRLRYEFGGRIRWRYRMSGLLPDWSHYSDPLHNVFRPAQMGPVWLEAKYRSGMPIRDAVWFEDPPRSSFPACVAVKCAGLQSPEAAEAYLRRTREAVMIHGRNVARRNVLLELAEALAADRPEVLDFTRFARELGGNAAHDAFAADIRKARAYGIARYPTLLIGRSGEPGRPIVGYRPYDALLTALAQTAPGLEPERRPTHADDYRSFWQGATEREIAEAVPPPAAAQARERPSPEA